MSSHHAQSRTWGVTASHRRHGASSTFLLWSSSHRLRGRDEILVGHFVTILRELSKSSSCTSRCGQLMSCTAEMVLELASPSRSCPPLGRASTPAAFGDGVGKSERRSQRPALPRARGDAEPKVSRLQRSRKIEHARIPNSQLITHVSWRTAVTESGRPCCRAGRRIDLRSIDLARTTPTRTGRQSRKIVGMVHTVVRDGESTFFWCTVDIPKGSNNRSKIRECS